MFTWSLQNRSLLAVFAMPVLLLLQPLTASAGNCGSADRTMVALHFAEVIFPELKGKEFDIGLSAGMGSIFVGPSEADGFHLVLDKPTWHPPGETNEKSDATLTEALEKVGIDLPFYLYFSFIEMRQPVLPRRLACRPVELRTDTIEPYMLRAQKAIDPHPDWTDAQELEEARKLGLRYGPEDKEAVLRLIPLKELSKFYGPLKITNAEFFMNGGQKCTSCSFVLPRWEVKVSAPRAVRWLSITVEPFFGRITNLSSGE